MKFTIALLCLYIGEVVLMWNGGSILLEILGCALLGTACGLAYWAGLEK